MINTSTPETSKLLYGVPQGSCAGPVIFTLYIAALNKIVEKYSPTLYGYADDHKLAVAFKAGNSDQESAIVCDLESCLDDIGTWMAQNKLKMNNSKTEIIVYGNKQQLSKVRTSKMNICGSVVECVDTVRDLGVWMQSSLTFDTHIKKKSQIANYQLHNLKTIRPFLSKQSTEILVHGLVHSHLDFCNALFIEQPAYQIDKLQKIQNRAARIVTMSRYDQPAMPLLQSLHWLPVRFRVRNKIISLVFQCINNTAPLYLRHLLAMDSSAVYSLRNKGGLVLKIPKYRTKRAERSFSVAGPRFWNALPMELRAITGQDHFRKALKTHLFKQAF